LPFRKIFFSALEQDNPHAASQLGALYYQVRSGIGFNKTPREYGAFPCDPYSHTPKQAGAQQPGMTGQVKEEVLTRFGELGVRVTNGRVKFNPSLLRLCEFYDMASTFNYVDVKDQRQKMELPANSLVFTWCQVPILYHIDEKESGTLEISFDDGSSTINQELILSVNQSQHLFERAGKIKHICLKISCQQLLN